MDRIRIASIACDHSAFRVGYEGMGCADDGRNPDAGKSIFPRLEEFHTLYSGIAALRSRARKSTTSHASQVAMARTNRNTRDLNMILLRLQRGVAVILDDHGVVFNKKEQARIGIYSGFFHTELPAGYKGSGKMTDTSSRFLTATCLRRWLRANRR